MSPASSERTQKIFISYSGTEYGRMKELCSILDSRNIPYYIDRSGNHLGDPVTAKIEEELKSSTLCLVYYSHRYSKRHACQSELIQVLLADAREGGEARTVVVNPEKEKGHIHPAVLKDQLYLYDDQGDAALDRIVNAVQQRLDRLQGTFQGIDFRALSRIVGRRPGVGKRVRRYGSMWDVHTALHAQRYGLTHQPTNGIAVLTGLPGAGKTALADDYRLHFAHEYGLVIDVDLGGAVGIAAGVELREAAAKAEAALETTAGKSLLVVDSIPAGVPHALFTAGFDRPEVLTLLITEHTEYAELGQEIQLAGLTEDEAQELFYQLHAFDREDQTAVHMVGELVSAVDYHPEAVALVAGSATARNGLTTLTEHVGRVLDGTSDIMDKLSCLFDEPLEAADDYELAVLRLMAACGPAKVPARLIRDVLTTVGLDETRVTDVLERLSFKRLMQPERGLWFMPSLLRLAVRRDPGAGMEFFVSTSADYLVRVLAAGPETHRDEEWALLLRHARHLVEHPGLSPTTANALLPSIARQLRQEGRPASAARYLERLFDSGIINPALAVEAASDYYESGEYEQAIRLSATPVAVNSLRESTLLACWGAAAFDALGQFSAADALWQRAKAPATDVILTESERHQVRLLSLRGQRLRGVIKPNISELDEMLTMETLLPARITDLARIELAHLQMSTGNQRAAREHARHVLDAHVREGKKHYPLAIDAAYVLATAELRLHFTELRSLEEQWAAAEQALRSIARQREEELGPRNIEVLATRVSIDFAIVSQGRAKEALANAYELLPILKSRLSERHPIVLREHYIRGLASSQLAKFTEAINDLGHALEGQIFTLGIAHPETLGTQFEFAMALKLRDDADTPRANALLDEVVKRAPSVIGRRNDLFWQAVSGALIARRAPACLLRAMHKLNHGHKW